MKAIQIVVDQPLLDRVDRLARRWKLSRSASIRRLISVGLREQQLAVLAEAEERSYRQRPPSKEERAAFDELSLAQERVLERLGREEPW
jgi:metal-responsive CopG/Arc/MetJ family transcriptional regulator